MNLLCYLLTRLLPARCWVGRGRDWIAARAWAHARELEWRDEAKGATDAEG